MALKVLQLKHQDNEYTQNIKTLLSSYENISILENRDFTSSTVDTDYFIKNDSWELTFFENMEQYRNTILTKKIRYKNISFLGPSDTVKLELKLFM